MAQRGTTPEIRVKIRQIRDTIAPGGHQQWTAEMVAQEAVRRGVVEKISRATVGNILNTNG